jgi:hypothetical protein
VSIAFSASPSSRWSLTGKSNFARRTDLAQHHVVVLAALGDAGLDDVADAQQDVTQHAVRGHLVRLRLLHLGCDVGQLGEQRSPLIALRLGDALALRPLLRAQLVAAQHRLAPAGVGLQQRVDERCVLAPSDLRAAYGVGVVADELEVDHPSRISVRR